MRAATLQPFFDDFPGTTLDQEKWFIVEKNWGGQVNGIDINGGVIRDNVCVQDGLLLLSANGNSFAGKLRGVNRDGTRRADGRRVGAAVATREFFGSGRYEVRMCIIPRLGVASAMWIFHYQETSSGQIINHEIDIELPGRAHLGGDPDYRFALASAWRGEGESEHTTHYAPLGRSLADNKFHVYRFDRFSGSDAIHPHVDFFIDNKLFTTITSHVPSFIGRLYIGAWFPRLWAGEPQFEQEVLKIDWVRITPFADMHDVSGTETYPAAGMIKP